jgi:hypothetical protein
VQGRIPDFGRALRSPAEQIADFVTIDAGSGAKTCAQIAILVQVIAFRAARQ